MPPLGHCRIFMLMKCMRVVCPVYGCYLWRFVGWSICKCNIDAIIIAYPFLSEYKDDVLMPSELTQPIVRLANSLFK